MRRLSRGQPCRGGVASKQPRDVPSSRASVRQHRDGAAEDEISTVLPPETTRLKRRRRAPRPLQATMEFVKNVLRAISPFKGSRDDDDAPATAGALNGLAAAAKKPAAAAPAPTRSSARQAAKAKAPAKRARGVPNIRVSRLSYVVVERRARLPTSSDRGGGGRRRRGRAGPRRAASPAARGAAGPAAPARPLQSQAAPSSPSHAARHRVRSERLASPPYRRDDSTERALLAGSRRSRRPRRRRRRR